MPIANKLRLKEVEVLTHMDPQRLQRKRVQEKEEKDIV